MGFWIIAGALAAGVAALLALAMVRGRSPDGASSEAASDMQVYRDQLQEVDRDLARGVLSEEEAGQVRIEISRRLLAADRHAQAEQNDLSASPGGGRVAIGALAGVVILGALGLYQQLGAPGYPDLPLAARLTNAEEARENRPTQATAEAEVARLGRPAPAADARHVELVEQLRAAMADRPDDIEGHTLLARNEASIGNFAAAHAAQARLIDLKAQDATAGDYADLADYLILAAGGFVSPEAERALLETLRRDPTHEPALYYTGLLYAQTGRPDRAFEIWRALLDASTPRDPWYLPIRAQIEGLAELAGVRYAPPAPPPARDDLRGPSDADIAAAEDMTPEDRVAMIEGMVASLSDRLANDGGTAEEWAQLITALGVLGRTDEARAIADEAMIAFAAEPAALPLIEDARRRAGLIE